MSDDIFRRKADEMLDQRLAAIEEELKLMRRLIEQVARFEERVLAQMETMNRIEKRLDNLETRLHAVEKDDVKQTHSLGAIERFIWIAIASIAAWIGSRIQ